MNRVTRLRLYCLLAYLTAEPICLFAAEPANQPVTGLAAGYPGDRDLASDPHVLFVEDFEAATVADVAQRWETVQHADAMSLTADVPAGAPANSRC